MVAISGTITLMGSGEIAESMRKVHLAILSRITGRVRAVFLDTPAGFQLNVDEISARAVEYFQHHLGIPLAVASYKSNQISHVETEQALIKLGEANYIFAGPGSPTYFIRQLQGTRLLQILRERLAAGAHIVFASAAAITVGRFALPVYEIYKVGEEPHWVEGLNLLKEYELDVVVIPHWNNAEGGTHDTRFCYLGAPRLERLENALPDSSVILGIDEHTACTFDPTLGQCCVEGVGHATVRYRGQEITHSAGTAFKLDELRAKATGGEKALSPRKPAQPDQTQVLSLRATELEERIRLTMDSLADPAVRSWGVASALAFLLELARQVEAAREAGVDPKRVAEAEIILKDTMLTWLGSQRVSEEVDSLVDLLVAVRAELRAINQWGLADQIRQSLAKRGIILEDGRERTTWRRLKQ